VKRIVWTDQAKADIRSLDKTTAMRILSALHRFVHTDDDTIEIRRVRHRSAAYR
jgi:mRNA-degrading endonuclease RelE of RelBE toxin-antitoxin system